MTQRGTVRSLESMQQGIPSRFGSRLRERPLLPALLVGYLAIYALWQLRKFGPLGDQAFISNAFFWPVELAAIIACLQAARRSTQTPRLARAWTLFGAAVAGQFTGDIIYTLYGLNGTAPFPSVADACYLAFYPLVLAGLLSIPQAPSTSARRRLMLDLAIVTLGGSTTLVYLVLGPTALNDNGGLFPGIVAVAYPLGDIVAIGGLALVLLRRPARAARLPLRLLSVALAIFIVADVTFSYQSLHGSYSDGSWLDALWLGAIALFALGAHAQRTTRSAEDDSEPASPPSRTSWLPHAAVALGFGTLLYSDRNTSIFPSQTLDVIAFTLAGLVALRQLLGQRDLVGAQGKLSFQALHDGLTSLPNRTLLHDRLTQALARRGHAGAQVAVLLLDVDDFKQINDTLLHAAGDELLVTLAGRLRAATREGETVARLGGDEFALVAEGSFEEAELIALAQRVMGVFAEPFLIGGALRKISGSLGIVRSNTQAGTPDELLRDADTAMYRAKSSGKGRFDFFDAELRAELVRHVELRAALERALRDRMLDVHYQPIVETSSGRTLAVEALCRWHDKRFGQVAPDEFIPLAEANGLIVPLGRSILAEAVEQLAAWRATDPQALPHGMFVNVSARELREADYCLYLTGLLARHGLHAADVAIELTERAIFDDNDAASAATVHALAAPACDSSSMTSVRATRRWPP